MDYHKKPLTQGFGTEIFGLDLSAGFSDNLAQELVGEWNDAGGLMVIHEQNLTSKQHIELSRHFGPLFGDPRETPLQDTVSRYIHLITQKFTAYLIRLVKMERQKGEKGWYLMAFGRVIS